MAARLLTPEPEEPHTQGDDVRLVFLDACHAAGEGVDPCRLVAVQNTTELQERFGDEIAVINFTGHGRPHGDLHPGNILFAEGSGAYLIDLVQAAPTHQAVLNAGDTATSQSLPITTFHEYPAATSAMDALTDVLTGKTEALDDFITTWLNRKPDSCRLAATTALLEDWWDRVDITDDDAVINEIARAVQRASNALKPLWERQVNGQCLEMLDRPINGHGAPHSTLADLASPSRSAESHVLDYIDRQFPMVGHPCVDTVIAKLTDAEARAVWAFAQERIPWHEAARRAGAQNPKRFGDTLSCFRVATDRVTPTGCATHEAPVPLGEVFEVSTHRHRSRVGSVFCRTRPAACPGRVGHDAHRHPRG